MGTKGVYSNPGTYFTMHIYCNHFYTYRDLYHAFDLDRTFLVYIVLSQSLSVIHCNVHKHTNKNSKLQIYLHQTTRFQHFATESDPEDEDSDPLKQHLQ